ncbi:hydrogenase nickel incorporation protein HypA/HybF [Desulfatibacillum alkenivorans DSM 16219]|jgi:hydrogenase nickel incorporation protein HypA/HybF|uniref:Hydrogenase maturation factor HypA n=1 Tax=Desulfatibacillum alkenivorans DSM 16219 TaxID=1121393 RepID=A0A1M6T2M6_9BACT|nr:hydrogenase maturation nickel metallochaperone HypA [Desulfatibacillum alkenivorans]SHK51150.1 hydrogenase nickel incorporation protein HypA/HybF [Desulfatibacillum alkenivorans DSM 16219]
MHEMGIALQIAEIAKSAIPKTPADLKVKAVNLRVGKLTAIVPDSLRFCFEIVAKDTPLAGAELNIEEIPIVAVCKECYTETIITDADFSCEKCKSGKLDIISGRELTVSSIEVADPGEMEQAQKKSKKKK